VDPKVIDADLVFNICNWILIEILKESGIQSSEDAIRLLYTRKVPLVQRVGDIVRTTNPKLSGTERILLLLYLSPKGRSVEELFNGTKIKIKTKNHLYKNLRNLESRGELHLLPNENWVLFGQGYRKAESIIRKYSK